MHPRHGADPKLCRAERKRSRHKSAETRSVRPQGDEWLMKVWIDQDLCTGDGLCEEICPAVFTLLDDGLAYVKQGDTVLNEPGGRPRWRRSLRARRCRHRGRRGVPGRVHLHRHRIDERRLGILGVPALGHDLVARPKQSSRQQAGRGHKSRVGDHPVIRSNRPALDVPSAPEDLEGLRHRETALLECPCAARRSG